MFRFFAILTIFVLAVFAAACGGKTVEVVSTASPSDSPAVTGEPTAVPTVASTATSVVTVAPTPPSTPEPTVPSTPANPVPGSCLVLPEAYCRQGQEISWPDKPAQVNMSPILGLILPVGTPIFAPFDGELRVAGRSPLNPQAPFMSLKNAAGQQEFFVAFGDIKYKVQPENGSLFVSVRKGDVLATVASSGIVTAGKYNVVMYLTNSQLFPLMFQK